jgi:hypothetical protein
MQTQHKIHNVQEISIQIRLKFRQLIDEFRDNKIDLWGKLTHHPSSSLSSSDEDASITLRLARMLATASPPDN